MRTKWFLRRGVGAGVGRGARWVEGCGGGGRGDRGEGGRGGGGVRFAA